jgi:glycosyltransferase involved in cell wall biosynthesis
MAREMEGEGMKLWTFGIIRNEVALLPWFVRHYSQFAERMIFWDDKSTDGSVEFLKAQPNCEVRPWPFDTGLDDEKFTDAANWWYKEAHGNADWVAWVDCDELLYAPDMRSILENAKGDVIPSTGYALISKHGMPTDDGHSQIYDLVKTGAPQPNYNKRILWRPEISILHANGRHYYEGKFPLHSGVECRDYGVKLLHLHHIDGVAGTLERNARNYERAHKKHLAWNYDAEHNFDPNQVGSVAWVERLIATNALVNVI